MRKLMSLFLAVSLVFGMAGCAGTKTVTPGAQPIVDTPAQKFERTVNGGAGAVDALSLGLAGVDKARKDLFAAGSIDAATNAKILTVLKAAASKNETARVTCALAQQSGDTTVPWQKTILDVVTEAKNLDPTLFGIKNAGSQAAFTAAFSVLQLTITAAEASFAIQQGGN